MIHPLEVWFVKYRCDSFITGVIHSLQVWFIHYRCDLLITGAIHSLQVWFILYRCDSFNTGEINSLQVWFVNYMCHLSITGVINWSQGLFCQVLFSDYRYSAAPLEEVLVGSVRCCSLITGTVLHRWKKYWLVLSGVVLWLQVQCCTAGRSTGWFCQVLFSDYRYSAAPLEEVLVGSVRCCSLITGTVLHRWKKYWLVLSGVVLWLQVQCCTAGRSTGWFCQVLFSDYRYSAAPLEEVLVGSVRCCSLITGTVLHRWKKYWFVLSGVLWLQVQCCTAGRSTGLFCQVLFSDYRYSAAPLEEVLVGSVRCCSLITGTVLHRWKKYWLVLSGVVLWIQVQCCTAGRSTGLFCQVLFSDYRYSAAPLEEVLVCSVRCCSLITGTVLHHWKKYWFVLSGVVLWLQVQCCTTGRSTGLFCQVFSDYRYSAAPLEEVLVCSVRCWSLITGTVLHRWKKYWLVLSGVVFWLQVQCCTAGRSTGLFCQMFSDYRYSAAPLEEVLVCSVRCCSLITGTVLHRWKKYWLVLSGVVLWLQVQCCTAGRSTGLFSALMAICSTSMVRTFHVRRKELWSGHRWNTSNPISR